MISPRDFLLRGLLAGLLAGFVAFGVAYVAGEPAVNAAIAIEASGTTTTATHEHAEGTADHSHAEEKAVVPRSLQSTFGLLTATAVTGVTLGGLVGVLAALALGRVGSLSARGSTLLIAGTGFVAVYLMPFVGYPPNPPAVGQPDTIGYRTTLYFTLLAISVIAAVVAILVAVRLRARIGGWYASLAAGAGYLLAVGVAIALLPTYDEVPAGFPAELLYGFRGASLLTQLSLWAVLGLVLAELVHRRVRRSVPARPVEPSRV
ncbi:MAG: CbtA family protein [Propionibacteriaceae bacterium]